MAVRMALSAGLLISSLWIGGEARAQCQVQKLVTSDASAHQWFGRAIGASGDWLIAGTDTDDDLGIASGSAYVFQRQGSTWVETQKLHASDGGFGDQFGHAVEVSGDIAVVSALNDYGGGVQQAGSAYVFERSGTTWTETAKLIASNPFVYAQFGRSVAISGGRIVVGAPDEGWGAVYVFERVGGVWSQTARLTLTEGPNGDSFGRDVSIDGDTIAIGAPAGGPVDAGGGYVFEFSAGTWTKTWTLLPNDANANDYFGTSVSISGDTILVGAGSNDTGGSNSGSAYVFDRQGAGWVQIQELTANDSNPGIGFGTFLTHIGDTAIIGAYGDSDNAPQCGSAYVFQRSGTTWTQRGKMLAGDGANGDLLGISVALVGGTALVGAFGTDDACPNDHNCDSGSVYVFELAPTAVQYGMCKPFSACGNIDDHGGCDRAGYTGAILAACGSGSVSTDDLRFEFTNGHPNKLTLLFMGPAESQVIYGNGVRVVGPQNPTILYRFGGAMADAEGRVLRGPGLVAQSQGFPALGRIQSGQTWNFQVWFRDPNGWCGGSTNFSNGVRVRFEP